MITRRKLMGALAPTAVLAFAGATALGPDASGSTAMMDGEIGYEIVGQDPGDPNSVYGVDVQDVADALEAFGPPAFGDIYVVANDIHANFNLVFEGRAQLDDPIIQYKHVWDPNLGEYVIKCCIIFPIHVQHAGTGERVTLHLMSGSELK